jgi:hypothetical protein
MRRTLKVVAGGRIEGLSVIGFHGEVDPSHTPGRREAVFADTEGHLVGMEGVEPGGEVRVVTGQQAGGGALPGMATRFARAFPAQRGFIVVVVGGQERSHADALGTAVAPGGSPSLEAFMRWLATEEADAPEGLMAQRLGEAVAWYCGPEDASALYQRIAHVAEKEMVRAACLGEESALYQMSWWRSRVALSDPDRYFAAVGLERSNRSMADAYLKAVLRKKSPDELEAGLEHARRQFDSLCAEARRGQLERTAAQEGEEHGSSRGAESVIGPRLARSRNAVRGPFMVRRAA